MEAELFRWIIGSLSVVIIALLGVIWKNLLHEIGLVHVKVGELDKIVKLDLRGLEVRITRIETHLNINNSDSSWNRRLGDS